MSSARAGEDVANALAFDPLESAGRVGHFDILLDDQFIAKHDANSVDGRACVVFLGHTVDRDFAHFLAVDEVHNEDFFVTGNAMGVYPEGFPLVLKLADHLFVPTARYLIWR